MEGLAVVAVVVAAAVKEGTLMTVPVTAVTAEPVATAASEEVVALVRPVGWREC
jgi:hypothetical protein